VIFQDDSQLFAVNECSTYGLYNGRLCEQDEDIIYVNKEVRSIFSEDWTYKVMSYWFNYDLTIIKPLSAVHENSCPLNSFYDNELLLIQRDVMHEYLYG
jgi:hypothetical protein